jgi:3-carboxy-cis,cis-muconate cycloisomerase
MTASVFDSPMFTKLYPVGEAGRLFTHSAEIRAALLVLGTLAKVQTERGEIPEDSAFFIHRSSMEVQIDPAGLADGVAEDGNYIPALVAAFDKAMEAPEHSKYILHNAHAQDVADTALMLRLRQLLTQADTALQTLPDSDPRTTLLADLPMIRETCLRVAFIDAPEIGTAIGDALKLGAPQAPRAPIRTIANWLTLAGDTAANTAPASPANAALRAQLLGLNALFQETSDGASEALYLPQISLSSLSLLNMAAA